MAKLLPQVSVLQELGRTTKLEGKYKAPALEPHRHLNLH
jgi:hypothetical protein